MRALKSEAAGSAATCTRRLRERAALTVFVIAALGAALAPFAAGGRTKDNAIDAAFPGWPVHYEGRPLTPLPLTAREERFAGDFPGRIARFSEGRREIIVHWVAEPRAIQFMRS